MSDQTAKGVEAPDQQTTESEPQKSPQEPAEPAGDESPTRSFAGFRKELVPQSERRRAEHTPVLGIPRVDAAGYGAYYDGAAYGPEALYRSDPVPHTPYPELSTSMLLRPVKPPPSEGWRRLLYVASGRLINLGESPRATRYNNMVARVNRPLRGTCRIAVLSVKGGVGKTTITALMGSTFAAIRGDRVVAVDASPDRGTLSHKIPLQTTATVRQLLRDAHTVQRYSDVRRYTSQGPTGLEVVAAETDPASSDAFTADDYDRTLDILERFYGLVVTDCGPGLLHSVTSSVLARADLLVVVSTGSIDGARSASATLDFLDAHGHADKVRNAIVVINAVRPRSIKIDMTKVVEHFSRRCRAVLLVPFDPHLEEGAEISLVRLRRETREAITELAATVADGFPGEVPNPGVSA